MESLFKARNIEISYEPVQEYIYCDWIGFQNEESVKGGCQRMLELLSEKHCRKVLNDNTKVSGPWQAATQWVGEIWFPQMETAGLKHFAWIFSPNLFAELSAKKAMPASNVVQAFHSFKDAQKWLISQ